MRNSISCPHSAVLADSAQAELCGDMGLLTGFPKLDGILGGLRPGQLIVLAGGTSVGKSSLAAQIALNVALAGKFVQFFAFEMTGRELANRMLSILSDVNGLKVTGGRQTPADWERTNAAMATIDKCRGEFVICDEPMSIPRMTAEARRTALRHRKAVDFVVIDYLQLVLGSAESRAGASGRGGHRSIRERIVDVVRGAKHMASQLGCPVLLLSQLSRFHKREGKRPDVEDLAESSEIENAANAVLLMHKPSVEDNAPNVSNGAHNVKLRVAKNRSGVTTTWDKASVLRFHPSSARFAEGER